MLQARTAPIQRVADAVSGKFAYGVMAAAAATFAFWSTAGTRMFPQVCAATTLVCDLLAVCVGLIRMSSLHVLDGE